MHESLTPKCGAINWKDKRAGRRRVVPGQGVMKK